ncbi:MAG: class I SAM-dependent methyltransferase, partial [Rhodobacteraceae bacterium]|nr:class I SAM-dependent methyltransferase [Paracoccaceae bacterium]
NSVFELNDAKLDPTVLESELRAAGARIEALGEQITALEENLTAAQRAGPFPMETMKQLRLALDQMAADANTVVKSKYWKRSSFARDVSNSLKRRRGRVERVWPESFSVEAYIEDPYGASGMGGKGPAMESAFRPYDEFSEPRHLTCVSMVRNESARADEIMRHLCALFDRVVIVDHLSEDNTAALVARYNGQNDTEVVLLKGTDAGYYQAEYMTGIARAILAEQQTDWLFFLDFDEVLPFQSRLDFQQAMVEVAASEVVNGHWYNLDMGPEGGGDFQGAKVTVGPQAAIHTKIALNVPRLKNREIKVAQGNHAVYLGGHHEPYFGDRTFGVFHLPVTGIEAFRAKLEQGVRAYAEVARDKSDEGVHWKDLLDEIDTLAEDPVLLREVALRYGQPLTDIIEDVKQGKLTPDTRPMTLSFAQIDMPTDESAGTIDATPSFSLETIDAVLAEVFKPAVHTPSDPEAILSKPLHETLTPRDERLDPDPIKRASRITRAVMAGATNIEVIVPTAWSGHKAFLYSLMDAMRPRRYVELGTYAGASFFAACQHMKDNGHYGEAVAIDIWEGDIHSNFYDESVFDRFKGYLNMHFPKTGSYIRGYFEEARKMFEPNSIELLHIDGLHTYEAVKEDYLTWRPAVTENGTIIFHDTSEYQTDFGVWQLFEEIASDATASFRFRHTHGLGVMAFGDREINPAIELLEYLSENPAQTERYYATLGSALFEKAQRRFTK